MDWADQKHARSLPAAATGEREEGEVEHSPEAVEEWIQGWRVRFSGTTISRVFGAIARRAAESME
jgi:hypothetical protein